MRKSYFLLGLAALNILVFISVATKASDMIKIPHGVFMMGEDNRGGYLDDAKPKHVVKLNSFFIDKYEITQAKFMKLMKFNPVDTRSKEWKEVEKKEHFKRRFPAPHLGDNFPVIGVSWYDAARYCNARSKAEGLEPCYDEETWECDFTKNGYRLPTEAEWEYACRAGTDTKYFFGDDENKLIEYANYWPDAKQWAETIYPDGLLDKSAIWDKPLPNILKVGQKEPNPWGLYDMLGNASEWCNDWYDKNYYEKLHKTNPKGPKFGQFKVVRGGSFSSTGSLLKCAYRGYSEPLDAVSGFRCVRNAPKDEDVKDDKEKKKE